MEEAEYSRKDRDEKKVCGEDGKRKIYCSIKEIWE